MATAQALVHDVIGTLLHFAHAPALLFLLGPLASWPSAELGLLLLQLLRLVQDEVQFVLVRVRVVATAVVRHLVLMLRLRL